MSWNSFLIISISGVAESKRQADADESTAESNSKT